MDDMVWVTTTTFGEIKLLYSQNKTFTEIGRMFNTSDVQIKLMLKKEGVL